ncbi:hypothetical protein DFQ28_003610 [Apophysomyces sp. BC1034]|nr:hypothetical protein DFQ30_003552 [Apophysomyces sp. BC1015]KAG0175791.1 hypothetical protein DFQ29_006998 [Apophysomyces sp. BC1021]KAG0189287.1 hypothetical protein DFQ28_003610 [Apophysomyces sp. BC1034]
MESPSRSGPPQPFVTITPPPFPLSDEKGYAAPVTQSTNDDSGGPLGRAGLSTKPRLILMTSVGSFWGFAIGSYLGGRQSGLQYLAENAHRLPTTVQGWYFYHKTKNYRMMLGGVKRGARFATRTGALCLLYGALEAGLDDVRGEPDIFNSMTAGVTTGALFSALSKFYAVY